MADRNSGGITGKGGKNVNPLYKEIEAIRKKPTNMPAKWEDTRKEKAQMDKQSRSILKSFGIK